jgi:hypothetical protein
MSETGQRERGLQIKNLHPDSEVVRMEGRPPGDIAVVCNWVGCRRLKWSLALHNHRQHHGHCNWLVVERGGAEAVLTNRRNNRGIKVTVG